MCILKKKCDNEPENAQVGPAHLSFPALTHFGGHLKKKTPKETIEWALSKRKHKRTKQLPGSSVFWPQLFVAMCKSLQMLEQKKFSTGSHLHLPCHGRLCARLAYPQLPEPIFKKVRRISHKPASFLEPPQPRNHTPPRLHHSPVLLHSEAPTSECFV